MTKKLHLGDLANLLDRYEAAHAERPADQRRIAARREECRSYAVEVIEAARNCGLLSVLRTRLAQHVTQ